MKALLILGVPMALTMCGADASARKKKKPPAAESTPASSAAQEQPAPAAAATPAPSAATEQSAPAAAATPTPTPVQEQPAPVATTPVTTSAVDPTTPPGAAPTPTPRKDGVRFRGGISLGGGGEFVSGFTAGLGGLDGRLGVQINNLIGVYLQPHLSFGTGKIGMTSGATGTAAATVVVDFTFINKIFVGAGGGYGLVNNPNGPVAQLRFGGYPVMRAFEDRARRKGLMIAGDVRAYFTPIGPVMQMMASVGYEAY